MTKIGRLDLARALRVGTEVAGGYAPELGEGLVPTVQVLDLDNSPFSAAEPWCLDVMVTSVAAQYSIAALIGLELPGHSWIEIETVTIVFSSGAPRYHIDPCLKSDIPAGFTTAVAGGARQGHESGARRIMGHVGALWGNTVTPQTPFSGMRVQKGATDTMQFHGRWAVNQYGALRVMSDLVTIPCEVSFQGRLHLVS